MLLDCLLQRVQATQLPGCDTGAVYFRSLLAALLRALLVVAGHGSGPGLETRPSISHILSRII